MLEAFQASARAEQAEREAAANGAAAANEPAPGAPSPEVRAGAGGPFDAAEPAAPPPSVRQRTRENDELLGISAQRTGGSARRLPWIVAALVVGMVAMFFVGRDFGRETEAGPDDGQDSTYEVDDVPVPKGPGAETNRRVDSPPAGNGAKLNDDDVAFLSRENRFSVRAIQFDKNPRGSKLALESYHYLRAAGFPAVAPITQGKVLVICVGAEPSQNAELRRLRAELQRLPGPPPRNRQGEFESAYYVNIEDQIDDSLRR